MHAGNRREKMLTIIDFLSTSKPCRIHFDIYCIIIQLYLSGYHCRWVPLAKHHRFGTELNLKLYFAYFQSSCSSLQPFEGKSTFMFEEREGGNAGFERKSGKPVRLMEWLNISPEGTFLREYFISKKKYTSRTLFEMVIWYFLLTDLYC